MGVVWLGARLRELARALSAALSRARQTLQFQTVQHQPTTTDCQPTLNNGIQVFVTGKLAVQRPPPRSSSPFSRPPPRYPLPTPPLLPVPGSPSAGGRRQGASGATRGLPPRSQRLGPRCGCAELPPPPAPHRSTEVPTR